MTTASHTSTTAKLSAEGVSIWLDDLSRDHLRSGDLAHLVTERHVVGVTTNPTIFAQSVAGSDAYTDALRASAGHPAEDTAFALMVEDVAQACDVLHDVYERTQGEDGRVSIEVSPLLAHNTQATIDQAIDLAQRVGKPGVMVKIPATREGLPAITEVIAHGISVNATLIFSVERYRHVIDAYLAGLQAAHNAGRDLSTIRSVASLFVSRIDTEVNNRLTHLDDPRAQSLMGRVAIANARIAYDAFTTYASSPTMLELLDHGAHLQRPLWASTGVKDPQLRDTLYVEALVASSVVNTMPRATLNAFADHGEVRGNTIIRAYDDAYSTLEQLADLGVDLTDVTTVLEEQGVEKFTASWNELLHTIETQQATLTPNP